MAFFGRQHLEKGMVESIDHYNHARPHEGIEQRRPYEAANVIPCRPGQSSVGTGLARFSTSTAGRPDEVSVEGVTVQIADTWADHHPLASGQARRWGSGPPPANPTDDAPWMRALDALVRAEH